MVFDRRRAAWTSGLLALAVASWGRTGLADEPVRATDPKVFSEPGEITDVVDAFDDGDPFDLHLTLGYQYTTKSALIRRETAIGGANNPQLSTGLFTASNMNVATYQESISRLNMRADIGVYKDIALVIRMPIILSSQHSLDDLAGANSQQPATLIGAQGEQLFQLPFKSPQRSGIEYLALGVDFGLLNQMRDPTTPSWTLGVEGRFSVSTPMHACNGHPPDGQVSCAYPSDVNRNGVADANATTPEGNFQGARDPGVSRGTSALDIHTFASRRIRHVEPYMGLRTLFEFKNGDSDFGSSDLRGSLVNHPPIEGWAIAGIEMIPWEQREQFQRLVFDARLSMSYRSEGRDYSELFDALGSSSALSLRTPAYAAYQGGGAPAASVVDQSSEKVYFSGITDVAAYATIQALGSVLWQAGQYIKFQLGGSWTRVQNHLITIDQACNPHFGSNISEAGPCRSSTVTATGEPAVSATGIPNPNYRATIEQVGRRFKVDDTNVWNVWLNGVVMF